MEELAFELSGEHGTLPKSEVIASIEAYGWTYRVTGDYDQLLILETDADPAVLAHRLALTHNILRLIFVCPADEAEILAPCRDGGPGPAGRAIVRRPGVPGEELRPDLRVLREKAGRRHLAPWLPGEPGQAGRRVTGGHHRRRLRVREARMPGEPHGIRRAGAPEEAVLPAGRIDAPDSAGGREYDTDKRRPRSSTRSSGTGGILVEAGLISPDIHVVGCDIQEKMARGACKNLRFYGVNYDVILGDSLSLGIRDDSVDAIVTDFPYGQSTPITVAAGTDFYKGALAEMYRVLKPGRRAVVVSKEPMEKLLTDVGFTVIETHRQRIHRSLTRQITVARKSPDKEIGKGI